MLGLRTNESEKFNRFFAVVQEKAKKLGKVFFLYSGHGNDFSIDDMEGEELLGWLIPKEYAEEFQDLFEKRQETEEPWDDYFCRAKWEMNGGKIEIKFT